jgi:ferredoxin
MDRLKLLDAGLRAFDARLPDTVPPLCVATRYRASSCRRCLDVCPGDAIEPSPWLRVDPELCTSCGGCSAVCRTGALAFAARGDAVRARLAEAGQRGQRRATLACRVAGHEAGEAGQDGTDTIVVTCLGGLSAADLIGAAAAGLAGVTLAGGDCETCRDRAAGLGAGAAVEAAGETLAALGRDLAVERRRVSGDASAAAPAAPGLSRRDLFTFLARGARRATAEGLAPQRRTVGDLHGQARPPAAQARLLDDLDALGSAGEARAALLPAALPLATLVAGAGCTGCGLCTQYCPHGALALAAGVLTCERSRCSGCGLCAEACPPAALELRPAAPPCGPGRAGIRSVVRLWPAP